jgi:hypothetical protein
MGSAKKGQTEVDVMLRQLSFGLLLAAGAISGCKCSGTTIITGGDGGPGSGDGGNVGDGGRGRDGGGSGGDGGQMGGGVDDGGFNVDAGGSGVSFDPDAGGLVLNGQTIQLHYAWIANNCQGWVSKYDTDTGNEVARYYTAIPLDGHGNLISTLSFNPNGSPGNNSPSRTAIDLYGNAWIANRAPVSGVFGSVTKIANSLSDCVDRNHNGKIDTSQDLNGNGYIDPGEMIVPTNPADPTTYDECVLFSTQVGNSGGNVQARALAISQGFEGTAGDVWVGVFSLNQVLRLSSTTGDILSVDPTNLNGPKFIQLDPSFGGPYGAAVDGSQRLWVVHYPVAPIQLALIDTLTGRLITDTLSPPAAVDPNPNSYGMGVDGKQRVWIAGLSSGAVAFRYDHGPGLQATPGTWTKFDFGAVNSTTGTKMTESRGIAVDDQGTAWMSGYIGSGGAAAQLIGFDSDTGAVKTTSGGQPFLIDATDSKSNTSIGVGLDANNNIWVNNYSGNAMKIDHTTGAVFKTQQQPAGSCLYTYSDFTGYELRHFTAPRGTYQQDFQGCGPQTSFQVLSWDATQNPPTTQIQVYVKVGATIADLNNPATTQYGPFTTSPINLTQSGVPTTFQYIRVIFVLTSADKVSTPVLKDFNITWSCTGQIG